MVKMKTGNGQLDLGRRWGSRPAVLVFYPQLPERRPFFSKKQAVSGLEHDSTTTAAHARNRISRFDCNEQRRWHYKPVERRWRSAEMPGVLRERAPLDPTVSREGQILNTNTRRPAEHTQASELRSVATEIGKQVAGDHSRPGRCMRHAGPVQVPG